MEPFVSTEKNALVVDNVVKHREIFGVLGPNGSGKSTRIRLLATLLPGTVDAEPLSFVWPLFLLMGVVMLPLGIYSSGQSVTPNARVN